MNFFLKKREIKSRKEKKTLVLRDTNYMSRRSDIMLQHLYI